jgi:hypothetical protein
LDARRSVRGVQNGLCFAAYYAALAVENTLLPLIVDPGFDLQAADRSPVDEFC